VILGHQRTARGAAAWLLLLAAGGCGLLEDRQVWNSEDVLLSVHYDTIPGDMTGDSLLLRVQYDTVRNAVGYPLLWVTVSAHNLSGSALVGETNPCGWRFRAYGNEARDGDPIWVEEPNPICQSELISINLPPGATQTFRRRGLPFDSIVAGFGPRTVYFAARLRGRLGNGPGPIEWLTAWTAAGSIELVP